MDKPKLICTYCQQNEITFQSFMLKCDQCLDAYIYAMDIQDKRANPLIERVELCVMGDKRNKRKQVVGLLRTSPNVQSNSILVTESQRIEFRPKVNKLGIPIKYIDLDKFPVDDKWELSFQLIKYHPDLYCLDYRDYGYY